jgi:MFS family permease
MQRYRAILALDGAAGVFAATLAGRVGVATYGLALVSMTVAAGGGYARAGLTAGVFAAAEAVGGPISGRLLDRYGPRRVLPALAAAHVAAVAALLVLPPAVVPAAVAGAALPPFGALAAARWSRRLDGDPRLPAAFALEALANDAAFLTGPLVAALLGGRLALTVAAGLTGAAALRLSRYPEFPAAASRFPRALGVLAALGAVNVLLGLTFGTVQLTVTARAATPLYGTMSAASLVAIAVHGARRRPVPPVRGLVIAAALVAAGLAGLAHAGSLPVVVAALLVIGSGLGPAIIHLGTLTQRHVPPPALTAAFALMAALSGAGIALSGPLFGHGPS